MPCATPGFHTAQVVDAGPEAEPPWLVTAFIPGPSLRQVVAERGPLDADAVRALAAGLAEGLAAIHACGLVHRDLKPGNVIVAPDGPRIIDFGIARASDATALTSTGAVVGTCSFMSPEQVRADATDPASDVFALGCVLAYAAFGRGPFDAPTIPAIVHRIVGAPPDVAGLADPHLRDLVLRCLEKDPAGRPSVQEVLTGLAAGPPSRPSCGGPRTRPPPSGTSRRRRSACPPDWSCPVRRPRSSTWPSRPMAGGCGGRGSPRSCAGTCRPPGSPSAR